MRKVASVAASQPPVIARLDAPELTVAVDRDRLQPVVVGLETFRAEIVKHADTVRLGARAAAGGGRGGLTMNAAWLDGTIREAQLSFAGLYLDTLAIPIPPWTRARAWSIEGTASGEGELDLRPPTSGAGGTPIWHLRAIVEEGRLGRFEPLEALLPAWPEGSPIKFREMEISLRTDGRLLLLDSLAVDGDSGSLIGSLLADRRGYVALLRLDPGTEPAPRPEGGRDGWPSLHAWIRDGGGKPRVDLLRPDAWQRRRSRILESAFGPHPRSTGPSDP